MHTHILVQSKFPWDDNHWFCDACKSMTDITQAAIFLPGTDRSRALLYRRDARMNACIQFAPIIVRRGRMHARITDLQKQKGHAMGDHNGEPYNTTVSGMGHRRVASGKMAATHAQNSACKCIPGANDAPPACMHIKQLTNQAV